MCVAAFAQQKPVAGGDEATLKALEEKWHAANLKGDGAAMEEILADTFITTNPDGTTSTKAEVLAQFRSGEMKWQDFGHRKRSLEGQAARNHRTLY